MPYDIDKILQMDQEAAERERLAKRKKEQAGPLPQIPLEQLEDFPKELHRFHPASPERLEELKESIRQHGILSPLIVRPLGDGKYQILAGHNRRTAARELGFETVPCIVKELLEDDEAIQIKNADNLDGQREVLPSERGWAYRQEMEIRKRQGRRTDLTSSQVGTKLRTDDMLAKDVGIGKTSVQRYIRLTYLIPELLELVDTGQLGLVAGEQLSYLRQRSQEVVFGFCYSGEKPIRISEALARKLREVEADPDRIIDGELLEELTAKKARVRFRSLKLEMHSLREYFPTGTPENVVVQTIHAALAAYFEGKEDV